ncbi:MAG: hypothetical protein IT320_11240 [Anaerolineae bacterium]|nr:hypothetical protein [Anaerolineae bacterium]
MSAHVRRSVSRHLRRSVRSWVFALVIGLVAAACVPTAPQIVDEQHSTPTPADVQPWRTSAQPISLETVAQVQPLGRLDQPDVVSTIMDVALSPDDTRLAALTNSQLVIWDLLTGETVLYSGRSDATQLFYAPDKTELYGMTPAGEGIVFDAQTGALADSFRGHDAYNGTAAFDRDNGWLALGGSNGVVKVWDPLERTSLATFDAHDGNIIALAFSPDGTRLATAAQQTVRLWDWRARQMIHEWDTNQSDIGLLAFGPGGDLLAAGVRNGAIIWNTDDGEQVYRLPLAPNGATRVLAFAPDGRALIGGSDSAGLHLWSLDDGALIASLPELEGSGLLARFSPDSTLLVTAGYGSTPSIWNLTAIEGNTLGRGPLPSTSTNLIDVYWTDDGRLLLLIDAQGPIYVLGIPEAAAGDS